MKTFAAILVLVLATLATTPAHADSRPIVKLYSRSEAKEKAMRQGYAANDAYTVMEQSRAMYNLGELAFLEAIEGQDRNTVFVQFNQARDVIADQLVQAFPKFWTRKNAENWVNWQLIQVLR